MKVEDIHKNNILTFVKMTPKGNYPDTFDQYHQLKTSPYETRREGRLDILSYRIEHGARSVKEEGAKPWKEEGAKPNFSALRTSHFGPLYVTF